MLFQHLMGFVRHRAPTLTSTLPSSFSSTGFHGRIREMLLRRSATTRTTGTGKGRKGRVGVGVVGQQPGLKRRVDLDQTHRPAAMDIQDLVNPFLHERGTSVSMAHIEALGIEVEWFQRVDAFQQAIGIQFCNPVPLYCALIHHGFPGLSNFSDHSLAHQISNRRLEFLGDAVLGFAISSFLFQSYHTYQEGQLTQLRSMIVNNGSLSAICQQLDMHSLILVNPSIERGGNQTIQAGALESLVGAIFMDQGIVEASEFVNDEILPRALEMMPSSMGTQDPVSELYILATQLGLSIEFEKLIGEGDSKLVVCRVYGAGCLEYSYTESHSSFKNAKKKACLRMLQDIQTRMKRRKKT